jgi:hypothetical protein
LTENISIKTDCPICEEVISFDIDHDLFSSSKRFPIQLLIEHCDKQFIVYVDENHDVKGIQSISNILDNNHINPQGKLITSEFIESIAQEEKEIISCNSDYDTLSKQQFPNVLEKQTMLCIAKHGEISIAVLRNKLIPLEKALNRTIDTEVLLKIIDSYVSKGILNKQIIKFEKENANFDKLKINMRGDVI